jgi:uncharacterized protein (DUF924 family)
MMIEDEGRRVLRAVIVLLGPTPIHRHRGTCALYTSDVLAGQRAREAITVPAWTYLANFQMVLMALLTASPLFVNR